MEREFKQIGTTSLKVVETSLKTLDLVVNEIALPIESYAQNQQDRRAERAKHSDSNRLFIQADETDKIKEEFAERYIRIRDSINRRKQNFLNNGFTQDEADAMVKDDMDNLKELAKLL